MSDVKACDVCGDTYELRGVANRFLKLSLPWRYKVWKSLPHNRDKIGYVEQDLCRECRGNLEEALRYLKETKDQ